VIDHVEIREATLSRNRRLKRRRWILLLTSIPVVIALIVIATKLMSLAPTANVAIAQYDRQNFSGSATTTTSLLDYNYFEPWIPWFDRGVAYTGAEAYVDAIDNFEQALVLAPNDKKCPVVINLSLSWEKLGDAYSAAGYYAGAVLLYQTGAKVLAADGKGCPVTTPPSGGRNPNGEFQAAEGRLQSKIGSAEGARDRQANQNPSATDPQKQLNQLEQRGTGAAQDKANNDSRSRGGDSTGFGAIKPW
jgi:tetratricopeptide (TPR) repeat protein